MKKLILVDDEIRQCRGLQKILSREYQDLDIRIFTSAQEALSHMETDRPDIVITDICMPDMDGLQMTEAVKRIDRRIIVILLTGFAEFEYAQKAISLGAFEYLIKPLNPDKLRQVLEKADGELKKEKVLSEQHEKIQRQLDMTLPVYIDKLLNQWVYGWCTVQEKNEVEKIIPEGKDGFVLSVFLPGLSRRLAEQNQQEAEDMQSRFKWWMRSLIRRPWHSLSFFSNVQKDVMITIVVLQDDGGRSSREDLLKAQLRTLETDARRGFPAEAGVDGWQMVIGELCRDLFHSIESGYRSAVEVLPYFFYFPETHILRSEYIRAHRTGQIRIGLAEEEAIKDRLSGGDVEGAQEIFQAVWDRCCAGGYPEPAQLKNTFQSLVNHLSCTLNGEDLFQYQADEIDSWETFLEWTGLCLERIGGRKYAGEKRNAAIAQQMEQYLEEHFAQDVTLEELADWFGLTPAYCSRLIKAATGDTFCRLLLKKRIQKTKEMLHQTELHIYEIAELAGYGDVKYFNRVFKRETGITPIQYRKALKQAGG